MYPSSYVPDVRDRRREWFFSGAVTLWRSEDREDGASVFEIAAFRSLVASLWHVLSTSAAEFGYAPSSCRLGSQVPRLVNASSGRSPAGLPMTTQRIAASIEDLRALGREHASPLHLAGPGGPVLVDPAQYLRQAASIGTQEFVNLSEDLLVVCTNFGEYPSSPRLSWNYNLRGWLYLHFRLDGVSIEESAKGVRERLEDDCFFISASSQHRPHEREVLSQAWRTVGIVCRPSFVMRELALRSDRLPHELQRFQSGDADIDFWFASTLTADMRDVIKAMFRSSLHPSIRPVYLRAKTTELICLALQRLHERELTPSALKLSGRDVECLREARRLLCDGNPTPSLQQLAHQVGINRRKLVLGFKQVFGMTVGDYARERRLDRARESLERGVSVGYAAAVAGYSDAGSFTKAFLARYGALPSHARAADSSAAAPRGKK